MHILVTEIYVKQKNVLLYINLYIAHRWLNLGQIDSFFFPSGPTKAEYSTSYLYSRTS